MRHESRCIISTQKAIQELRTRFSELYIKTGLFPVMTAAFLQTAFALRQEADYDLDANIDTAEASGILHHAATFILLTGNYLDSLTNEID